MSKMEGLKEAIIAKFKGDVKLVEKAKADLAFAREQYWSGQSDIRKYLEADGYTNKQCLYSHGINIVQIADTFIKFQFDIKDGIITSSIELFEPIIIE